MHRMLSTHRLHLHRNSNGMITSQSSSSLFCLCRSDWCLWQSSRCGCYWCLSSCCWRGPSLSPPPWDAPSLSWSRRHGGGGVRMQQTVLLFSQEIKINPLCLCVRACMCVCCIRFVDVCLRVIMRAMWFCGGFHWIKVKGERAASSEAPILTVAPHSTYFDAIPVTMTMCSIVAKEESCSIPVWGSE